MDFIVPLGSDSGVQNSVSDITPTELKQTYSPFALIHFIYIPHSFIPIFGKAGVKFRNIKKT